MNTQLDTEMREWLLECFSDDNDQETIEELTHDQLIKSINRYFDGGLTEFIKCCGMVA
jgi:uncharacterized protein with von Willebrand factor type A (vWA) domain